MLHVKCDISFRLKWWTPDGYRNAHLVLREGRVRFYIFAFAVSKWIHRRPTAKHRFPWGHYSVMVLHCWRLRYLLHAVTNKTVSPTVISYRDCTVISPDISGYLFPVDVCLLPKPVGRCKRINFCHCSNVIDDIIAAVRCSGLRPIVSAYSLGDARYQKCATTIYRLPPLKTMPQN